MRLMTDFGHWVHVPFDHKLSYKEHVAIDRLTYVLYEYGIERDYFTLEEAMEFENKTGEEREVQIMMWKMEL